MGAPNGAEPRGPVRGWLRQNRGFLVFVLGLALLRTAVADWNPVPTGSMRPTVLDGDVIVVNRLAWDLKVPLTDVVVAHLGEPARGDIATLRSPRDGMRLVKRIVAVGGDTVELRDDRLVVNGRPADYAGLAAAEEPAGPVPRRAALQARERLDGREHAVQFLPGRPAARSFGPVVVPPDHVLVLGDNRDDSLDSRFFGPVPRSALIGRVEVVAVSADIDDGWRPRLARWASRLH